MDPLRVVEWLRGVRLRVLDVETTGTWFFADRVVQVGMSTWLDGEHIATVASLVNPGGAIPPEATAINGVTDEAVKDAPCFGDAFAPLLADIQPADVLVAYNHDFDSKFLGVECARHGLQAPRILSARWLDPYIMAKAANGAGRYDRGFKLEQLCAALGIKLEGAHDAGVDAHATGEALYRLTADPGRSLSSGTSTRSCARRSSG